MEEGADPLLAQPVQGKKLRPTSAAAFALFFEQASLSEHAAEALRDAVDLKVAERVEEMWQRGKQMVKDMQQEHAARLAQLAEEIAACRAEAASLRGALLVGAEVSCAGLKSRIASTTSGTSSPPSPESSDLCTPDGVCAHLMEGFSALDAAVLAAVPEMPPFLQLAPPLPAVSFPLQQAYLPTPPGPQRVLEQRPLSLAEALAEILPASTTRAEPRARQQEVFTLVLQKAGAGLGLNVSHYEQEEVLLVEGIYPGGAAEAWNLRCATTGERPVAVGDHIISVNNVSYDAEGMLKECREQEALTLTIVGGATDLRSPAAPAFASSPGVPSPGTGGGVLRADAAAFVPRGAAIAPGASSEAKA